MFHPRFYHNEKAKSVEGQNPEPPMQQMMGIESDQWVPQQNWDSIPPPAMQQHVGNQAHDPQMQGLSHQINPLPPLEDVELSPFPESIDLFNEAHHDDLQMPQQYYPLLYNPPNKNVVAPNLDMHDLVSLPNLQPQGLLPPLEDVKLPPFPDSIDLFNQANHDHLQMQQQYYPHLVDQEENWVPPSPLEDVKLPPFPESLDLMHDFVSLPHLQQQAQYDFQMQQQYWVPPLEDPQMPQLPNLVLVPPLDIHMLQEILLQELNPPNNSVFPPPSLEDQELPHHLVHQEKVVPPLEDVEMEGFPLEDPFTDLEVQQFLQKLQQAREMLLFPEIVDLDDWLYVPDPIDVKMTECPLVDPFTDLEVQQFLQELQQAREMLLFPEIVDLDDWLYVPDPIEDVKMAESPSDRGSCFGS